jgi:hypothetical protein
MELFSPSNFRSNRAAIINTVRSGARASGDMRARHSDPRLGTYCADRSISSVFPMRSLRRLRRGRSVAAFCFVQGRTVTAGAAASGVTLLGALMAVGCFLVGCCGSPMLGGRRIRQGCGTDTATAPRADVSPPAALTMTWSSSTAFPFARSHQRRAGGFPR